MVQSRRILRRSSKHISSDLTHTSHPNKLPVGGYRCSIHPTQLPRRRVFSRTGGRTWRPLVLRRSYLTAPTKYFRTCDKGAQPYTARGKAGNHVTKVVHPKVHPAEAYEEHQQRCPKDDCRPSPPGS